MSIATGVWAEASGTTFVACSSRNIDDLKNELLVYARSFVFRAVLASVFDQKCSTFSDELSLSSIEGFVLELMLYSDTRMSIIYTFP